MIRFNQNSDRYSRGRPETKALHSSSSTSTFTLSSNGRNIIMVAWISLLFFSINLIYTLYVLIEENNKLRASLEVLVNLWSVLSFCLNFNVYYKTNLIFKKIFRKVFMKKLLKSAKSF